MASTASSILLKQTLLGSANTLLRIRAALGLLEKAMRSFLREFAWALVCWIMSPDPDGRLRKAPLYGMGRDDDFLMLGFETALVIGIWFETR